MANWFSLNMPSWWSSYQYPALGDTQRQFFTSKPEAGWRAFTEPARQYGSNRWQRWLNQQAGNYWTDYEAALGTGKVNQGTDFWSYLTESGQTHPWQDYRRLSPQERGENPSSYVGRSRWVI